MPSKRAAPTAMLALFFTAGAFVPGLAQQPVKLPPSAISKPYTLHVYQNLVQIPSMVLNQLNGSEKGLEVKDFTLRLDSGPAFHPLHVREEGNDPLAISLFLGEPAETRGDLVQELTTYTSLLPADLFRPADRLSVATAHCSRILSTPPQAANAAVMLSGVTSVANVLPGKCVAPLVPLWDVIGTLVTRMQDQRGRKVVLVVSDGVDDGSRYSWDDIRKLAARTGVTLLGVRLWSTAAAQLRFNRTTQGFSEIEDPFSMLCAGTGGIVLDANVFTVWPQVRRIISLLRDRYILEFQRPVNSSSGLHEIELAVKDRKAIVRVSGTTVPLPDPQTQADPSTVPTDTSRAPVMGNRRILPQNH